MSEEKLYRWSKSVEDNRLDWWETELIAAGVAYALEKTVNRKRWRITAYETGRAAAEKLKERFGGGVSALRPEHWQHPGEIEGVPLRIRDRLIVTQHSEGGELERLAAEFPGREILSFPPRLAFGTGAHPTTAGCLRLLADQAGRMPAGTAWPMLDLGCGSGILAVAAARMGAAPVDAVELDPLAIEVARENARRHDSDSVIRFIEGDAVDWVARGRSHPDLPGERQRYPVIAANLFSKLLVALLPNLPQHLTPHGGSVILSGFLTSQTKEVSAAAAGAGIKLDRFIRRGRWVAAAGSLA